MRVERIFGIVLVVGAVLWFTFLIQYSRSVPTKKGEKPVVELNTIDALRPEPTNEDGEEPGATDSDAEEVLGQTEPPGPPPKEVFHLKEKVGIESLIHLEVLPSKLVVPLSKLSGAQRENVAVSLVVPGTRFRPLHKMLSTLFMSDFLRHDATMFIYINEIDIDSDGSARSYVEHMLSPMRVVALGPDDNKDYGLTIPRIRTYEAARMMEERSGMNFTYFLELHDDMLFTRNWFSELIKAKASPQCRHQPHFCAVLMPFVAQPYTDAASTNWTVPLLEKRVQQYVADKYWEWCSLVAPWMLRMDALAKVGYYDGHYSPTLYADEDLYYRFFLAGFKSIAVQSSWLLHAGEETYHITETYLPS